MNIKKIFILCLMAGEASFLFFMESYIPLPGLVLSNIIIILALYYYSYWDALIVLLLQLIISLLFIRTPSILFCSAAGGLLSLYFMNLFKSSFNEKISIIGVSLIGCTFQNIGEILTTIIILQNLSMLFYIPIILLSSLFTGLFIGFAAKLILKKFLKLSEGSISH